MLPERYDDGGFTGANLERPAFRRLLADIDAGKVDVVIVYKVDRLSRSLLDFARVMDRFNQAGVAFVSVTQNFSTADAMGRLTLNMLISFAEFEREMLEERLQEVGATLARCEARLADVERELAALDETEVEGRWVARALADFDALWDALTPENRGRLVRALVARSWSTSPRAP